MAQNQAFTPEVMAKLAASAQYIIPAAKAISQIARFPGPDGRYMCDFKRISARFDTKDGCLIVTFAFVTLALVETGSQEHAGYPILIRFYCRASDNQTVQEAWNRLFTDGYQAMNIATAAWTNPMVDMVTATDFLNEKKPPVIISVAENKKNKQYRNFNIVEVLTPEATKHLAKPTLEITEDQMNSDELQQIDEPEIGENFEAKFKAAEEYLNKMSKPELLAQATASGVEVPNADSIDEVTLRRRIMHSFVVTANQDPAEFGLADVVVPFDVEEALEEALEEEGIEEESMSILLEATEKARSLDRTAIKRASTLYGITKFMTNQTDDVLRKNLIDAAVEANEIKWM